VTRRLVNTGAFSKAASVPIFRLMHGRSAGRLSIVALSCLALLAPALAPARTAHTSVVGGTSAEAGEYPWQIALLKKQGNSLYFICGGTLIGAQRVVTAAHCTSGTAGSLKVLVGTQLLSSGGSILNVASYADHPSYSSNTNRFDAAVLELSSSGVAAGGEPLQLIGEEGSADDALWAPGDDLAISGWGSTSEGGSIPNQLREARVPRVADSTCGQSDHYGTAFDAGTMVCAGPEAGGVDTCQGDSGGPLGASTQNPPPVSESDPSEWRLAGIVSWGDGCARPKKPGVYTRVAAPAIRDWILGTNPIFTLTVQVNGTGNGTVTSDLGTINCPPDCSFGYDSGDVVTLTPHEASGSAFTGWSGACSGTGGCTVTMTQARNVTATFTNTSPTPTMRTLTVMKAGGGFGTVTSSPAGINCGGDCSQSYTDGTSVTLTATPASGYTFAGWDGEGCSGTGTCTVSMTQARNVTATFGIQSQLPSEPPPGGGGGSNEPPPDNPPVTADDTPPVAAIASDALHMSRRGFVRVRIDCVDSPEDCLGDLRLRMRFPADATAAVLINVAHADFDIAAGDSKGVKARLRRRARHRVRDKGHVRVRVIVVVEDAAGNTDKLRKKLVLSAPE
jgi:secreted trypsin-like serine protease